MQTPVMLTVRVHDSTMRKKPLNNYGLFGSFAFSLKVTRQHRSKLKIMKKKPMKKIEHHNNSANTCTHTILKIGVAPKHTGIKA